MKKLKIKLLTGRSGADGSFVPGDKIDVDAKEAVALVESEQAEPLNKAEYAKFKESLAAQAAEEAQREAKANAIMQKEALELELKELYVKVAYKHAEIEGVVLSDEELEAFVTAALSGEKFKEEE